MAQLELPAPVLTLIVSKLIDSHSSESWKTLRLVCKALCARAGYFAKQLRLEVDADLPRKARRCMEHGFRADELHLVSPTSSPAAQHDQSEDQAAVLLGLFQLPIWSHLRTLRLRGVDLPESVLLILPQACPNLQELFLEGVVLDHSTSNTSSTNRCDVRSIGESKSCALGRLQPQLQQAVDITAILPAQQLPAVAVGLPRQLNAHAYEVQLCSITPHSITSSKDSPREAKSSGHSRSVSNSDSIAAARVALILSGFQHLRLLRMYCALAESVMHNLCNIHQRPCLQDQHGSMRVCAKRSSCAPEQPLLEYFPLLGWYLFNVTGAPAPCAVSSIRSGDSSAVGSASGSVQPSSSMERQLSAAAVSAAVAEAECGPGGDLFGSEVVSSAGGSSGSTLDGALPVSSSLTAGIINSSTSCPPSANSSSHQLAAISDSAAAHQVMQQQQLQAAEHICHASDEVLVDCAFVASQMLNNNAGRHSLDIKQQHRSKSRGCHDAAEAAALSANDACTGSGSFAVSCCSLGQGDSVDPELCSCGVCSFCWEDGIKDACSRAVSCSNSAPSPSKIQQGSSDADVHDALNNCSVSDATDSDTIGVCSDQQQ